MTLRSHFLTRLTNDEIEQYLASQNTIFIPVGVTEMHGGFPVDCETVMSEAFALMMAEKTNTLALSGLNFFYAGATASGKGTIQVSVRQGIDYLGAIARSLHAQGFTHQIYLSMHAPAHLTIGPMLRDLYDEIGTTVIQIEIVKCVMERDPSILQHAGEDWFHDLTVAGYDVLGRLEDIPLTGDYQAKVPASHAHLSELMSLSYTSESCGYQCHAKTDHMPTPAILTIEDRLTRAQRGRQLMERMVSCLDPAHLITLMEALEQYNQSPMA